ncbi:MAG: sensor histidine kinase, partial [Cyanobacteria bacterium J06635_10]
RIQDRGIGIPTENLSNIFNSFYRGNKCNSNCTFLSGSEYLSAFSSKIKFRIQDRGIGIPTENLSNIFNSFYRGNNVDTKPGTGLGLSIVKRCVDLHRGGIGVNSTIAQGTIFNVTLPR